MILFKILIACSWFALVPTFPKPLIFASSCAACQPNRTIIPSSIFSIGSPNNLPTRETFFCNVLAAILSKFAHLCAAIPDWASINCFVLLYCVKFFHPFIKDFAHALGLTSKRIVGKDAVCLKTTEIFP